MVEVTTTKMNDLIETLNATSPIRTVFYCLVALIALGIIGMVFTDVVGSIANRKKP